MRQRILLLQQYRQQRCFYRQCTSSSSSPSHSNYCNDNDTLKRKAITQKWIDSIVIGQKLCPFAPPLLVNSNNNNNGDDDTTTTSHIQHDKLRIHISNATNYDEIIQDIISEVHYLLINENDNPSTLDNHQQQPPCSSSIRKPETTLVVLNETKCPSIRNFHNFIKLSWRIQNECIVQFNYRYDLQIVLFHPLAIHNTYTEEASYGGDDDEHDDDAANYTIRSPFPIIHLLKEKDILQAVQSGYRDLEGLPSRNKAKFRKQGSLGCKQRLDACSKI